MGINTRSKFGDETVKLLSKIRHHNKVPSTSKLDSKVKHKKLKHQNKKLSHRIEKLEDYFKNHKCCKFIKFRLNSYLAK